MDEVAAIARRIASRAAGASQPTHDSQGPWTLELYPTLACNLSCGFCDTTIRHVRPVGELSAERQLRLVDEAADLGAYRVMVLGGGEPLLAAHTPDLLRRVKARKMAGMLTTNGTLLSPALQRLLVDIGWDEVHVSIDGAVARTHDRMRGKEGAFRRTLTAICRLRALRDASGQGAPRLAFHTVLTRYNVDELPALIRLASAVGAESVEVDALVAYRPEQETFALTPAERARLPDRIREGLSESERLGVRTTLARLLQPEANERGSHPPPAGDGLGFRRAPCLKPWHHLTVQADGRISPCCVLAGEGEAVGSSLADTWESSPFLTDLRARMLTGQPGGRCAQCSANILAHERNIRAALPVEAEAL